MNLTMKQYSRDLYYSSAVKYSLIGVTTLNNHMLQLNVAQFI